MEKILLAMLQYIYIVSILFGTFCAVQHYNWSTWWFLLAVFVCFTKVEFKNKGK